MARLKPALSEDDIKKKGLADLRKAYKDLARDYNRIIDNELLLCPVCNTWQNAKEGFYMDKTNITGRFYICKRCLLKEVEQRKTDKDESNETKESVQRVLKKMDRVYDDGFYRECVKGAMDSVNEKMRHSPFATYITATASLPQYQNKTWKDSDFGADNLSKSDEEIKIVQKTIKDAKKHFGVEYTNEDLMFLEQEYQDWTHRYPCENKSQEILYKQICFIELNINKAQRDGKDTKDLLKSLQEVMSSLQIKPSQTGSNTLTEAKTFGQLIEKWEDEWDGGKPIPDPDPDFEDRDNVIRYIDTFFKGHLAKMMGLKNGFSRLYDKFISKFTVNKPQYDEDTDSEVIFDQLFGKNEDSL